MPEPAPASQRPKRRRARRSLAAAEMKTELYTDEELNALYEFARNTHLYKLFAAEARRRGAHDVSPRDYYCCGGATKGRWLPVCHGKRPDCPVAARFGNRAEGAGYSATEIARRGGKAAKRCPYSPKYRRGPPAASV